MIHSRSYSPPSVFHIYLDVFSLFFHSGLILIKVKFDLAITYIYSMTGFILKRKAREEKNNGWYPSASFFDSIE